MRVITRGNWSNCVGTEYCYALGTYSSLEAAESDAEDIAWENWEPADEPDTNFGTEDEGPDYWIEEYDPDVHDMHKAGGGSFEDEFLERENKNAGI